MQKNDSSYGPALGHCLTDQPKHHLTLRECSFVSFTIYYWLGPKYFIALIKLNVDLKIFEKVRWSYFLSDWKGILDACFNCLIRQIIEQSYFSFSFYQNPSRLSFLLRNLLWFFAGSFINDLSRTLTRAHYLFLWKLYFGNWELYFGIV